MGCRVYSIFHHSFNINLMIRKGVCITILGNKRLYNRGAASSSSNVVITFSYTISSNSAGAGRGHGVLYFALSLNFCNRQELSPLGSGVS